MNDQPVLVWMEPTELVLPITGTGGGAPGPLKGSMLAGRVSFSDALDIHLDSVIHGAVIGIQPLVEFVIMPFTMMLARRIGLLWLMSGGAALTVAAGICFATTGSALGMFAGQILMGGAWAIFASLGIVIAQRLLPTAVATASGIFMSSTALSSALGGLPEVSASPRSAYRKSSSSRRHLLSSARLVSRLWPDPTC